MDTTTVSVTYPSGVIAQPSVRPLQAIMIINLPKDPGNQTTHGPIKLHRLPVPRPHIHSIQ